MVGDRAALQHLAAQLERRATDLIPILRCEDQRSVQITACCDDHELSVTDVYAALEVVRAVPAQMVGLGPQNSDQMGTRSRPTLCVGKLLVHAPMIGVRNLRLEEFLTNLPKAPRHVSTYSGSVEPGFFETVRDAFEGFVAGVGGRRNSYVHNRGLKVWFDDDSREHYESQLIRVDGEVQLEIGFHSRASKGPTERRGTAAAARRRAGVAARTGRRRRGRGLHRPRWMASYLRGLAATRC